MRGVPDGIIGVAQITRCVYENSAAVITRDGMADHDHNGRMSNIRN